ncbi:DUF4442 domain-containing protein [Hydrocarboniclastica marina]|uniref:DUF4442 domain-containing protein n=1 Tax=Hydrocarboniclastica marina TaxID=2259620 RepID=A0A4V1D8C6_9ALTE|nr:DUF4442 domain-containing protein [Hydrocarboniclastica marina]QCF24720.1 DUF4442 domain-containing protein [Hydrocarboniclastica marina]
MSQPNKLSRIVDAMNRLPSFARKRALSTFFGRMVPYTGTTGIRVEVLEPGRCIISLPNKKRVQNHIGSVHAIASMLIAESATGFLVGLNLPDSRVPVIKTVNGEFVKRAAKGEMRVVAHLTPKQIELIRSSEKGETTVPVELHDSDGREPIIITMVWAWTPKNR